MSLMNKKGFTLIELLIAAAIFAFAMSGILLMFTNCAFLDEANRNKSIATIHAETAMEYMRSQDFSTIQNNLCSGGVPTDWNLLSSLNLSLPSGFTNESIKATTTQNCCSESPLNWLVITVEVSWLDKGQRSRSLTLGTSISK